MKYLIATTLLSIAGFFLNAQENNPLINSGELIDKASVLHDEGKYKEAIALYKKVAPGDTNYYRAVYEMAFSQKLDSQYIDAKQSCEKGLAEPNERWPELLTLYGNIIDDMGDAQKALLVYDSAISLYPAYSELYLNKGTTLMRLEQYAEAEEVFKKCLMINPYQASSHYKLGYTAYKQGKVIQAMMSYIDYLLLQPAGRYQNASINGLSAISSAGDDIRELVNKRTGDPGDNFSTIEKILLSKIALDKNYKPLLKLDDPISRQIQVLFEKLEYDDKDPDFWMQYYVPLFKSIFDDKKFEPFINRLFANVKIEMIQDYVKKKEKAIQEVVDIAVAYFNQVRATREMNYSTRKDMNAIYHHDNGRLFGKGNAKDNGETLTGDWEFYYSSGNMRSKGRYNDKGEKTGPWQYYHFNGVMRGRQTYKDGKLEGEEIFYYDNGNVSTHATFKDDLEDGETRSYYMIGIPRSVTHYKQGKKHGERKSFSGAGFLTGTENYKEDSLDGPFKTYHINGNVESQGSYNNGKLEGPYKVWFDNGKLSREGTYSEGKLKGLWKEYHENGKLKLQETLVDGEIEGEYAEYYDNSQLFYKCHYKKGKASGDVEYFDRDGKRFFTYTYDNNIIKTAKYYDKSGKETGVSEKKSKKLDLTTYYADGFKRSQATYNDNGELNGNETYYFRSGKISSENAYINGLVEGPGANYYENGKKWISTYYTEGEKNGYEKNWYQHGQLREEGWYQEGMMQGMWLTYNELGNLIYTGEYFNNDLNGYRTEYFPDGRKNNEIKYNHGWLEEIVQFDTTGKEINRCSFKNGNGKLKEVFFNGNTYSESNFAGGELEGFYKFYFFDGKLNTLQFYKKGKLDSIYRHYFYGGQISIEGQYSWGVKQGIWKYYFENGKLKYTEDYNNGELTGKKTYYYENGKVDTEVEFEKGEKNGWTKQYAEDGSLAYQTYYRDDLPVAYTYLDKTGKLLPEMSIPGGSGKVKTFYANGNPSGEFEYADGKLIGNNISYFPNGKLKSKGLEDYSLSEGIHKYYYANGQLQYEYQYLHNNAHGPYKEYNENGILIQEGYFYNGELHNTTKIYDDTGKLKETRYYYYGKLLDIKK